MLNDQIKNYLEQDSEQEKWDLLKTHLRQQLSCIYETSNNNLIESNAYYEFDELTKDKVQKAQQKITDLETLLFKTFHLDLDCWGLLRKIPSLPRKPPVVSPEFRVEPKIEEFRFNGSPQLLPKPANTPIPQKEEMPSYQKLKSFTPKDFLEPIPSQSIYFSGVAAFLVGLIIAALTATFLNSGIFFWIVTAVSLYLSNLLTEKTHEEKLLDREIRWKEFNKQEEERGKQLEKDLKNEYQEAQHKHHSEYNKKIAEWERQNKELTQEWNKKNDLAFSKIIDKWKKENLEIASKCDEKNHKALIDWQQEVDSILSQHEIIQLIVDKYRENYLSKKEEAIANYYDLILIILNIKLPFLSHWNLTYIAETQILVLNYMLPEPKDLPSLKEVKFIKNKDEFKEIHLSQTAINKLYDDTIYQIILAVVAALFKTDEAKAIESIVFNGWIDSIDKATGNNMKACIVSLQTNKIEFEKINLKNVNPKECFRHLKGVGSSQLYGLTPIPPIMKVNSQDKRFIPSYDVAHTLDDSVNIAAMDWEDFEHLVREIFQKILSKDGIEVKVTQSSRDKGVDAIAIDPHPLTGGRIVIQAKRYTNVVGVSAVRDLYGTLMNEGANKGILVTTSNFGKDAYEFAKGKALTLVSGGELLLLLNEHGYKAKIDLKEAKKMLASHHHL